MKRRVTRAAKRLGVTLQAAHLPPGILGFYDREKAIVYFEISLSPDERWSVVGHELGHVYYGHGCDNPKHEDQADAFAAWLLIDPERYALAESVSTDVEYLADELDVAEWVIVAFKKHVLQRLGLRTYVRSPQHLVA
ncbi:ImmA/IrrE family metallo-endopeptidase [Leucobacter muris]|uniref:ImmA/IrrE family metallo-endopeptidase n=1 Tax=Leucobacter muris TaxID=1935379 RepID=A0ABX5QEM4_9MICO|nr:ImmA/IrrE family metallo-endopeptidase [Leucobacter muris]QAB17519.1 ImmA/IrrE family metallo-endopeptidase [Leucobacter muris]